MAYYSLVCTSDVHYQFILQVECKKAQPKEVMLPANLAKTRTAGRGTYGELVVLSGSPAGSLGAVGTPTTTVRYAPYPIPAHTITTGQQAGATTHILPLTASAPSIIQYASQQSSLYDAAAALSYKRLLAATAASMRSHHHHPNHPARATATLSYPLAELLGIQGLDISSLYQIPSGLGL